MRNKNPVLVFIICVTIVSCRTPRYVYSPASPNNPYFREKGESKLTAYYSTGADANTLTNEYNNGYDLQAAYAISDHFALTADYFKRNEKDAIFDYDRAYFDSSVVRYDRNLMSFGAGYFTTVTNDRKISINIFGGLGFGKFSFSDNGVNNGMNYHRDYASDMSKWSIQPSINFFVGNNFRTSLISKLLWVRFNNIQTSYTPAELTFLDLDRMAGKTVTFVEAGWNLQLSFKSVPWLYFEGGFTVSSDPFPTQETNVEARNFNAAIGIGFDFSKMKMKNIKEIN